MSRPIGWIAICAVAGLLGGAAALFAGQTALQAQRRADIVRNAAVKACENSQKPGGVRYIIAAGIRQQLAESAHVDYHKFFPNIPAGHLHALIHRQRRQQFQEIADLLDVDCNAQYPKP